MFTMSSLAVCSPVLQALLDTGFQGCVIPGSPFCMTRRLQAHTLYGGTVLRIVLGIIIKSCGNKKKLAARPPPAVKGLSCSRPAHSMLANRRCQPSKPPYSGCALPQNAAAGAPRMVQCMAHLNHGQRCCQNRQARQSLRAQLVWPPKGEGRKNRTRHLKATSPHTCLGDRRHAAACGRPCIFNPRSERCIPTGK